MQRGDHASGTVVRWPSGKLEFEPPVNRNTPRFQQLWRLILFFAEQLNASVRNAGPRGALKLKARLLLL